MIYIRRDWGIIPDKVLAVAQRAKEALEQLPEAERADYIKKKSHIWKSFKKYLKKMSYGKCWYSESLDAQSFFDVDHFRPKLEAKRDKGTSDDGYPWLAFDRDNFRFSAARSNRLNKNEKTDETEGKGSWFPLCDEEVVACWDNRCEINERPILLDPINDTDVALLQVSSDGRMEKSRICVGTNKMRVERSVKLYGLNLPDLVEARKRVMRKIASEYEKFSDDLAFADEDDEAAALTT